jgi:hypothetical protein
MTGGASEGNSMYVPRMTTEASDPDTGAIFPSIAEIREDFPSPVLPTIATKLP